MRDITRHYITQPLRNYSHLNIKTKGYYDTKPQSLKAPLYPADPNVREVILAHLKEYADTVRSGFRKLAPNVTRQIWTFTLNRMTLDQCAAYLIKHYVFKSQSEQFTTQSKARIALMRRVAKPLVRKKFAKGQDTGFWPNLAAELEKLYGLHGEDTNSPGWEQWAAKIIEEDESEYTDGSTSMPPPPEDLPA
ncbi:hypothetical protein EXIGLDRAFT_691876 [Exidia glandulosa HHB12029]|uniref:Uncharacterized protein n=1 Tax=Exidia glandulosa HHB12029 TaxID=1314781 RepID=A0A165ICD5_EXIGL|nr:hypothetical protein EXIGLDRAFT_691876 [Exidia glandulosa HHB12029]